MLQIPRVELQDRLNMEWLALTTPYITSHCELSQGRGSSSENSFPWGLPSIVQEARRESEQHLERVQWLINYLFLFVWFFETGFLYVTVWLSCNSLRKPGWHWTQRSICLCLLNSSYRGLCHHCPAIACIFDVHSFCMWFWGAASCSDSCSFWGTDRASNWCVSHPSLYYFSVVTTLKNLEFI